MCYLQKYVSGNQITLKDLRNWLKDTLKPKVLSNWFETELVAGDITCEGMPFFFLNLVS